KIIELIHQSTTPAATGLCNTLTIIVLRPPPPSKGGETFSNLCIYNSTLRLTAMGHGGEFMCQQM
ncbi:MAG TPA: hypothetical protein DCP74_05820, partial [Bacteroidales bacterium]|nr:hypothetical protein [Bacteroidales bacterium]